MTSLVLYASLETRTITALVAPYGERGYTSAGVVSFEPGAIVLPADVTRVKLLDRHSNDPAAPYDTIGFATAALETPAGLQMTFSIVDTPAGTLALTAAHNKSKDGFSVELNNIRQRADVVMYGELTAVAHTALPAFTSARTITPPATTTTETDQPMTDDTPSPAPSIAATAAEPQLSAEAIETPAETPAPRALAATLTAPIATATTDARSTSLTALTATVRGVMSGERSPELTAALDDITYSASPWALQPDYVGELWDGNPFTRQFVDVLDTSSPLKSFKSKGWRWTTPPTVAAWAGDKTEVPSDPAAWEEETYTAQRFAGANDIAREFYDFGDNEAIAAYLAAQTVAYAKATNTYARTAILAAADANAGAAVTGGFLKAAATVANDVYEATDGFAATALIVNNADWLNLVSVSAADVPAFLSDLLQISPGGFIRNAAVPAGTVIALARPALKFRELPGSPIRVEAEHVPRGGRDVGVFGYALAQLENPAGIRKRAFT